MIFFIIIVIVIILSNVLYFVSLPGKGKDVSIDLIENETLYFDSLYHSDNASRIVKKENLNFLWDNMPVTLQKNVKKSKNTSFKWPPDKGERSRLTAFPYPDGKNDNEFVAFAKGMASLLNNTSNSVTFPGWLISVYDPKNPNDNIYADMLNKQIPWDSNDGPLSDQKSIYLEVTHACYPPPDREYPECDDGGYWLYMTPGSGVFWSTGSKCLVANNKIDGMFKMLETTKGKMFLKEANVETPLEYMSSKLKGSEGGTNLVKAMREVIKAMQNDKQIPKITAFRNMKQSTSYTSWYVWVLVTTIVVSSLIGCVIYLGNTIKNIIKKENTLVSNITRIILSIILPFLLIYIWYWYFTDKMLRGFGYETLGIALKEGNLTVEQLITNSRSGTDTASNSLAMIQNFDFDLSSLASLLGLDSIIFHTQPNKSGAWAVEIMDVRNTPFNNAKSIDDLIYPLGLCGSPIDGKAKDNMPSLKQGPLEVSEYYLGYQPTGQCNCDEKEVKMKYEKSNEMKNCVFCSGSFSDKLC